MRKEGSWLWTIKHYATHYELGSCDPVSVILKSDKIVDFPYNEIMAD